MKHKGERHIPDFSRKQQPGRVPIEESRKAAPASPKPQSSQPKPHGTSAKSGRRGQ